MIKNSNLASKKAPKKQGSELKEPAENGNDLSRKELLKFLKGHKDPSEKNSKERRVLLLILDFFTCSVLQFFINTWFLLRRNILNGRWRKDLFAQIPSVKTEIITGIGGFAVMEGYLLKVLTPRSGDTTAARKRY